LKSAVKELITKR